MANDLLELAPKCARSKNWGSFEITEGFDSEGQPIGCKLREGFSGQPSKDPNGHIDADTRDDLVKELKSRI